MKDLIRQLDILENDLKYQEKDQIDFYSKMYSKTHSEAYVFLIQLTKERIEKLKIEIGEIEKRINAIQ